MLYAELRKKLGPDRTDHERREDILTSTVFGTLVTAGAQAWIADWCRQARGIPGQTLDIDPEAEPFDYWFWPRLGKEPDVILRMGDQLIVVEVKYRSPLSNRRRRSHDGNDGRGGALGQSLTSASKSENQLVEEWRCCRQPKMTYPEGLQHAISDCHLSLVYLIDARDGRRAERELADSRAAEPSARFFLLTWQDLHRALGRTIDRSSARRAPPRWARDLCQLMEQRTLAAFGGCSAHVPAGLVAIVGPVAERWQRLRKGRFVYFPRALAGFDVGLVREISGYLAGRRAGVTQSPAWVSAFPSHELPVLRRLALYRRRAEPRRRWGSGLLQNHLMSGVREYLDTRRRDAP